MHKYSIKQVDIYGKPQIQKRKLKAKSYYPYKSQNSNFTMSALSGQA